MNLLNDIKKKIHRDQGFTITEVLAATIILGLSMTIVTTAIILAYNRFYRQVEASQAQELCASLCTSIQDELTYASDVKYGSGDEVLSFYSDRLNGNVNFYLGNDSDDSAGSDELLSVNTTTATKDDASRVLLAMVDTSGGAAVVDEGSVYGLVSAGAYELDTGGDLGLRASMSLKGDASDESFLVKVNVYGVKNDALLSTKTFRVGQFNKSTDSVSTVNPSLVTLLYTLNFDGDGHGTPSVSTIDNLSAGDTIGFEGTKDNWPTVTNVEDGYIFTGWSDGTNTYGSTSTYTVNGGATFTAVYAVSKYTVTFHGNGGKIDNGSENGLDNYDISSVNQGSTVTLPSVSRKGYTFVGWNTAANGSGSEFTASTAVNADTEVYAIWTPDYRIDLYNGTTLVGSLYCGADGTPAAFLADDPAYKGTSFTEIADNIFHSDESDENIAAGNYENWILSGWYYIDNSGQTQIFKPKDDENTDLTDDVKNKMTQLLASNNTVNLYAGYVNTNKMYVKTDRLVDGKKFLIIGGDNIGTDQKALTNNGTDSVKTANVTVRGDSITKYVLYADGSANVWYASNGSNSRLYIRNSLNDKYLNIKTARTDELQLSDYGIMGVRQWIYDNYKNELTGHWVLDNRYVNYSSDSFNVKSSSSNSANIHIYELKEPGTVVSFNGYNY